MADPFFEGFEGQPPGEDVNITTTPQFDNILGGGTPLYSTAYARSGTQCSEQTVTGSYGFGIYAFPLTAGAIELSAWFKINTIDTGFTFAGGTAGYELLTLTGPLSDAGYLASFNVEMSADAGDTVPQLVLYSHPVDDLGTFNENRIMAVPDGGEFGVKIVLNGATVTGYVYDSAGATTWTGSESVYTGGGGADGFYVSLVGVRIGRLGANYFDVLHSVDDVRLAGVDTARHIRAYPRDSRAYPRPRGARGYPAQP